MPSATLTPPRAAGLAPARAWPLALGLAASVAAFAAVYVLFVLTARGQWVDEQALRGAQEFLAADAPRAASMHWLNRLPEAVGFACGVGLIACAWIRRDVVVPLIGAACAGLAIASTQLLKHELLLRPDLGISQAWGNSFPSGHTTAAAAASVALLLAAPRAARPVVAVVGAVLSAVTGAATVVMGWHRPSDVVGALLVCVFWLLIGALALGSIQATRASRRAATLPAAGAGGPDAGAAASNRAAVGNASAIRNRGAAAVLFSAVCAGAVCLAISAVVAAPFLAADAADPHLARHVAAGLLAIVGSALVLFPSAQMLSARWMR